MFYRLLLAGCLVFIMAVEVFSEPPPPTESVFVVYPGDCNHLNTLFGGRMLSDMDRIAGIATRRFLYASTTAKDAVTVAVEVKFSRPGKVGDLIVVSGQVIEAGEKSVTVRTKVERELTTGRELLAQAEYVFVAFDREANKAIPHGLTVK